MGTAAVTALLSAALAGIDGTAVELEVSGRAETSARVYARDGGASHQLLATDVLPRLSLALDRRTTRLALGYEPQLRLARDLTFPDTRADLGQGGWARARWDPSPLWRTTAAAHAAERLVDLDPSGGDVARLLGLRAPIATVRLFEAGASAGVEGRPTRLVTMGSTVAVESSSGIGDEGRAAIAGVRELRAGGHVAREQTPKDELRLELAHVGASFDAGRTASLTTVTAGWAHRPAPSVRLHLTAAASRAIEEDDGASVVPGGSAALDATAALLGRPLRVAASVRTGPAIDRFVAGFRERLGAEGSLSWAATPRWSVGASAAAGRILERLGYTAGRGDVRTAWRATRRVTLAAAAWSEWHHDPGLAAGTTASFWGTSLGVELAPARR